MKLVEKRMVIRAPAQVIYELLTDADLLVEWMAPIAALDPRPGGLVEWTHHNADTVRGEFLELVPGRRIVFTYGWVRDDVGIPPGSTTVEINLRVLAEGTELHLVHRGLEGPMADAHAGGWSNYLGRLATRAEGNDPGPDPLADGRVPAQGELDPGITSSTTPHA